MATSRRDLAEQGPGARRRRAILSCRPSRAAQPHQGPARPGAAGNRPRPQGHHRAPRGLPLLRADSRLGLCPVRPRARPDPARRSPRALALTLPSKAWPRLPPRPLPRRWASCRWTWRRCASSGRCRRSGAGRSPCAGALARSPTALPPNRPGPLHPGARWRWGTPRPRRSQKCSTPLWGGPETRFVISSDLSHYHDLRPPSVLDRATAKPSRPSSPPASARRGLRARFPSEGSCKPPAATASAPAPSTCALPATPPAPATRSSATAPSPSRNTPARPRRL